MEDERRDAPSAADLLAAAASTSGTSDDYERGLYQINLLRQPAIRAAVRSLQLAPGSRGLDVGCGIGLNSLLLAEVVGSQGHVTGLDISPEFLARAEELGRQAGLADRLAFQKGDVNQLPFDDDVFDWVWSADVLWPGPKELGCPAEDPLPLVRELVRVVKPGGLLALLFWSSQRLLPGHPLLEARLNTAHAPNAPFGEGMAPRLHALRALGWLQEAGLEDPTTQTFVADVHAPLSDEMRAALTMTFDMFWGQVQPEVSPEDWTTFQRLCQPDSPDSILHEPDYYAFLTYSLFQGRVPG